MYTGVVELDAGAEPLGRVRRGGGRKRAAELDPGLRPALLALVEPDERGDPAPPLRGTTSSSRAAAEVIFDLPELINARRDGRLACFPAILD